MMNGSSRLNAWQESNQRGFGLVESLVVLSIIGVMAVFAYPFVMQMLYAKESERVEQAFRQALREARAYSYLSKQDVMLCTLNENGQCGRGAKTTLVVFYDHNNNRKKDAQDVVIHQSAWKMKYGKVLLRTSLSRDYIRYMGNTAKPRGHIGHLQYCSVSDNPRLSFKLIVNMHGHIRTERGDLVGVGC